MDKPMPFASVRLSFDEPGGRVLIDSAESEALGQADRLAGFGQLAGDLARQMNSPLVSISNNARAALELLRDQGPPALRMMELSHHLSEILRQTERGSRIATKLHRYTRPDPPATETRDVKQVVSDVVEILTPMAQAKNVRIDQEFGSSLPDLPIGPAKLEQLLYDLAQNGIDACQERGFVRIRAHAEDDRIRLVIEDTGVGIHPEHLERIFDPFFTTKPMEQGTGLGLSTCRRIVVGAGGSIEINSAPGCGTVVTVRLPTVRPVSPMSVEDAAEGENGYERRSSPKWRDTLRRSFRRSAFIPVALLCASVATSTASACSTSPSERSEVASLGESGSDSAAPAVQRHVAVVARAEVQAGPLTAGAKLYTNYCAACHGENGDGNGPAARFLYPKPRNFRDGQYRMVSSLNHAPTDDDLMKAIVKGMPGSAMLPVAAHLGEADRKLIVAHVRLLTRQGLEARFRKQAEENGDAVDPKELEQYVESRITPDAVLETPRDLPPMSKESVARGLALYGKACAACHGVTGKGDGVQDQRDESGTPTRPRDLTRGIFKGGRGADQLYARIMLGMLGTPMPSSSTSLTPAEIGDLINHIQSLSDVATTARSEHRRTRLVAKKAAETLPAVIPGAVWAAAPEAELVATPLWWRDHADPDFRVKAVHDGTSLAIRLSWRDDSRNDQSGRVLDFPDMAAVELFKGATEPFLGMGASDGAVDVWLWNAAAEADQKSYSDVDTAHPNMIVDMYPFEKPADGPRAHATDRQPREFLTAHAAGNLRSDPAHPAASTNLEAKGLGSTTMRPRASQVVRAVGEHKDGRWTVVLWRPLRIASDAGLSVAPGDSISIAFAFWDGAVHDRNGQKMVSIWHDLKIE